MSEVMTELMNGKKVDGSGGVTEGRRMTCLTVRRFWRFGGALRASLRQGRCSGQVLEIVVGHCTFAALFRRDSLGFPKNLPI